MALFVAAGCGEQVPKADGRVADDAALEAWKEELRRSREADEAARERFNEELSRMGADVRAFLDEEGARR